MQGILEIWYRSRTLYCIVSYLAMWMYLIRKDTCYVRSYSLNETATNLVKLKAGVVAYQSGEYMMQQTQESRS